LKAPLKVRFHCWLMGHSLYVVQEFQPRSRRVGCTRCKREWAMHDHLQAFLPWGPGFEDLYRTLGYYILKT